MATREEELRIKIRLDETGRLTADLGGLRKELGQVGDAARRAGGGFSDFGAKIITLNQALELGAKAYRAVSAVVGTVAGVLGDAIAASNEQEEALAGLNTTLRSTGQFTEAYSAELQALAGEMQATTKFGDEAVLSVERMLVAMGAAPDQVARLTRASLDLATGLKGANATAADAASAAQLLGKAVAGEFGTLSRYGIIVDKNATDTQKLDQALAQIEQRFGGQAAAAAVTFGGKLTQINNIVGDLYEVLGDVVKQSDFVNDVLEATKSILLDLNTAAGASKTTLTELVDEGLRTAAGGAVDLAAVVVTLAQAFVVLASKAVTAGKAVLGALSGDPVAAGKAFLDLFNEVDTSDLDALLGRLAELRAKVDTFGTDAPRKLDEKLGGLELPSSGGEGPPGAAPARLSPAGTPAAAAAPLTIPVQVSVQQGQLQAEIDRIQRILDSETAHLPTETRMVLEAEQARLEQAIADLQPPSIDIEPSVPAEKLIAKRDEMQAFLAGATLEQAVAIQARIDEYNQEIARITGQPPPPVAVPVGADTSSADQSIQQSATTAEAAFDGPATKLKQIKDDAGNIQIIADGTEANTAIETVETNFERLREQFNQDNPKLAIDVDEALEGLVVVTDKGVEVRRELEGVPILVKVNTGSAEEALDSLKAEAAESPPPAPIRVDTSGAIAAINALRAAASQPIVIPVRASGSPSLPFSEYFGSYAGGVIENFLSRVSGSSLDLYAGLTEASRAAETPEERGHVLSAIEAEENRVQALKNFGVRRNLDTGTGKSTDLSANFQALAAIRSLIGADAREEAAARRQDEQRHRAQVAGFDRLARAIEANTAEGRQLRTAISTGTAAAYSASIIGSRSSLGSGRTGWR